MKKRISFLFSITILIFSLSACSIDFDSMFDDLLSTCEHEYVDEIIKPTCDKKGYTLKKCSLCGNEKKTDYTVALGHSYDKVVTKPTCISAGYTTYTCSVCNHTYKDDNTEATGHSCVQQIVNTDGAKYIAYSCINCDYKYTEELKVKSLLYGYKDLERYSNKTDLQGYYMEMLKKCEEFHNSTIDLEPTTLTVNGTQKKYYVLEKINYKNYNLTAEEAIGIWKLIVLDNPIFYWISNEVITGEKEVYLIVYDDYVLYSDRQTINSSISQMVVSCASSFTSSMTVEQKVKAIHDFIVKRIDYAYIPGTTTPTSEKWAYSIVGVAVNKKGVCEAYSEAFAYLCLTFDIECLIVTGLGNNEEHEWNIVLINDFWYGMDLTWDDYGDGRYGYDYYGMSASKMNQLHMADSYLMFNINYLYKLPAISSTGL